MVAVGVGIGKSGQASSRRPARIVFQSDRDGDLEIYTMNADGSGGELLQTERTMN